MTQYIDKNEVENILRNLWKKDDGHNAEHRIYYNKALQEVQCELDTLEVKEVDLEEEIDRWQGCEAFPEGVGITPLPKAMEIVERTAKHFFELGLNAQKGE